MKKTAIKRILLVLLCLCLLAALAGLGVSAWVRRSVRDRILTPEQAAADGEFDCILVLGCQVWADGSPSKMLRDRIDRGLELYQAGAAPKILMSGDHGTIGYDEVNAMKRIATDAGVASEDVFMDHAGFSTYESIYRARDVFQCKRILIVSQEYHLYRALYCAKALGLDAAHEFPKGQQDTARALFGVGVRHVADGAGIRVHAVQELLEIRLRSLVALALLQCLFPY